ncbi:NAD-dependent epimerase/dehydratase family protein [Glaciecola sp. HTCC2999]|uniref:NAD-dependent epimerase/dehydratase family protein n=1 Tax=Glaciecola sp. HTCC2999 TaxID=455436 RepID=UPI0000E0F5F1|nr:NAD-dependent epimerase/dehydratase family protein [Glaciecola sp. HTCC2999]
MNILLTGASGFIGQSLSSFSFRNVVRNNHEANGKSHFFIDDLNSKTNWDGAFESIDVVVHLAGLAHKLKVDNNDFHECNYLATLHLAKLAAISGVKRFVFISTIGVNGSYSNAKEPFSPKSIPKPFNYFSQSKYNAEIGLRAISKKTGMELVIIRPPLVYGPNAPGNFGSLVRLIQKTPVLPFGSINNSRDFISVQNLADLILVCSSHPAAAGHTFLPSDSQRVSIKDFTNAISKGIGTNLIQLPVPLFLMLFAGKLFGKTKMIEQLFGNLEVNSSNLFEILDWTPPYSMEESMSFLKQKK